MAHSVSHEPPPPPPPLFSFLKRIQCLAVTFNLDSKCGTNDQHLCKQKCVQFLNSPADFGRSPSSTPPESRGRLREQAAGELLQRCACVHHWALGKLNSMGSWCTVLSNSIPPPPPPPGRFFWNSPYLGRGKMYSNHF